MSGHHPARPRRLTRVAARIRVRVTAAAALISLIGALVASVIFVGGLHENLARSLVTSARQQADSVAAQLHAGEDPAQATLSGKDDIVIQVLDADGHIVGSDHPKILSPMRRTPGSARDVSIRPLDDSFTVFAERTTKDRLVVVGLSEEQVERAKDVAVTLLLVAVPVGVALISLVVWLAVGRALRPVEEMRKQAAAISSAHLDERLAVPPGDDEIGLLASTLNAMLDRIDVGAAQQRQFVADASHELRSPLAVLRQLAEVAQRHPDSTGVDELAGGVLAEEKRMEDLVAALLVLARLDDREDVRHEVVDVDDLVLTLADRLRTDAPHVDLSHVSAGQVLGDPVLIGQVVTNLLSNALRHGVDQVRVSLTESAGEVVLVVEDDGAGVDADDRERIFDRFARLDEARTRDAGGVGLGLAIVRKVVEAAGGAVTVTASELGGAAFTIRLPSAAQA